MPSGLLVRLRHEFLVELCSANGKMRVCGDAGLQFRVSRIRV